MSTPARPIPKRDLRFDFSQVDLANWHPDGRFVSHYFNVHSLQFPDGERFFINSVRHYRERITDPVLREQVAGFIAQEAMHGREHETYNTALARIGYPVAAMLRAVNRSLWMPKNIMPPRGRLAMTAALEHLTAIGAEDLLEHGHRLDDADPQMAKLWRWHAVEETEHKAVAFDVYRQVTGGGFIAWLRRCFTMLTASIGMTLMTWAFLVDVVRRDGRLLDLRGWGGLLRWLWIEPGTLRRQFPRYWRWFRPGFHPWQTDNYYQVERWSALYSPQRQGESS
ncbi:MAG TPA: metal-dependent hydrolase [Verrucomicrobiae bacterium]|nr:metal-dependent hydrolase [Verrucomicrobiae bacterium]